ncbi:putative elongator complex protein 4 [Aphelenchoides fujianensis]|nr:putative elongator complex protein 4 [Aphelenchoides fujianensis]
MIRIGDVARLPGTRIQNRCAVTSSGLEAVDQLMGGGLPIPSLLVVSESESRRFAPLFQKYFLAQGVVDKHELSSPSCPPRRPRRRAAGEQDAEVPDAEMRIAWRYKTMPALNSALSAKDKTRFDLSKPMELPDGTIRTSSAASYSSLWSELFALIKSEQFAAAESKTILRLLLADLGSPLFEDAAAFRPFLCQLRALVQTANVCVMVSVDESLLAADDRRLLVDLADAYFRLEIPDAESKKNMGLEERYDGRFHIVKLPLLNSIATNKPDCVDLVFEKHRRYVELRILHLPAVMGGAAEAAAKTPCQKILDQF